MRVRLESYAAGTWLLHDVDRPGYTLLYQTDWEYPSLAFALGWSFDLKSDDVPLGNAFGMYVIPEAITWLDEHDGEVFEINPNRLPGGDADSPPEFEYDVWNDSRFDR